MSIGLSEQCLAITSLRSGGEKAYLMTRSKLSSKDQLEIALLPLFPQE